MAQPTIKQFQLGTIDADLMGGESPIHYESYDVAMFKEGKVTSAGDQVARFIATREFTIPNNFVGSYAGSRTVTAGAQNFNIWQGGVQIGQVQFGAGSATGTIVNSGPAGPFVVTAGTTFGIFAVNADANQEDISIVIKAEVT